MSILYTRDGEGSYELPGRTVNTFASGLVRVDTSYAVPTQYAQATRNGSFQVGQPILGNDTDPAVDGLFLYPDAQEVRKEYGITELIASYYGRTRTDVPPPTVIERSVEIGGLILSLNDLFFQFVVPVGEIINFRDRNLFDSILSEPNSVYRTAENLFANFKKAQTYQGAGISAGFDSYTYDVFISGDKYTGYFLLRQPSITVIAQRNFGKFVEMDVTYKRNTEQDEDLYTPLLKG